MLNVLLTRPFDDEVMARFCAVDPRIQLSVCTPRVQQYLRGEAFSDPADGAAAEQEAEAALRDCEVLIGWARLPESALQWTGQLRWIQITAAGVDRFDPLIMGRFTFTNGTGVTADPIAEHVLMLLLMLARRAQLYVRRQSEHRWEREERAREIAGMTMGIVGLGAIGTAVAQRARALGLRVLATRRSVSQRTAGTVASEVLPAAGLHELLAESDVVVITAPLTSETRGLIGARELATMRSGSFLINIARGGVVDEAALIAALRSGHLGGAGLDVFRREPLPAGSPLWDMENVIITPHAAWLSDRADERTTELICDNLRRYLAGEPLRNLVDLYRGY